MFERGYVSPHVSWPIRVVVRWLVEGEEDWDCDGWSCSWKAGPFWMHETALRGYGPGWTISFDPPVLPVIGYKYVSLSGYPIIPAWGAWLLRRLRGWRHLVRFSKSMRTWGVLAVKASDFSFKWAWVRIVWESTKGGR